MKMNKKRIVLYELNTDTFLDTKASGYGDFSGILKKLNYFKYLNVQYIAIPDILLQYQNKFQLEEVKNRNGSFTEFINCVNEFKKENINITPIIDLANIKQTYINLNNMYDLYNLKNNNPNKKKLTELDTYLLNDNKININLGELTKFVQYFTFVINFYNQTKVNSIILTNYEFLLKNNNLSDKNTFRFLQDIYKIVKRENVNIEIILKSGDVSKDLYERMLNLEDPCFDYLYLTHLSLINLNTELKRAKLQPLLFKNFFSLYKPFLNDKRVILSFSSDQIGRINSRWGDELEYSQEAIKSFFLFLYSAKNSIGIFYGDELGSLRAKIRKDYNFSNDNFNEEKRFYESKNISQEDYFLAQSFQNKITAITYMAWNDKLNAGATDVIKGKFNLPLKYEKYNVESELKTNSSSLRFINNLNRLIFNSGYSEMLNLSKISFYSNSNGIAKIIHKIDNKKIIFLINLSNQHQYINLKGEYSILESTYYNKFYSSIPSELSPFESLILVKE